MCMSPILMRPTIGSIRVSRVWAGGFPGCRNLRADVARVKDFRAILDRKDIDAVVIATPDHWHAIQMIAACKAGKDVYVEKPLSATIAEGRAMVNAARKYDRIVQVGTHRRSSRMYAQLADVVHSGAIGKVTVARASFTSNMTPAGIGHAPESDPPAGLDWEMWLGPRPARPFQSTIMPYKFRWWHLYSSQMANWGVHYFDVIRWLTGELAPASVSAHGGRYAVDDDRTIPDTSEAIFEHASKMLTLFSVHEANGQPVVGRGAEIELRGTIGTVYAATNRYEIVPERGGAFQDPKPRRKGEVVKSTDGDLDQQAARDFHRLRQEPKAPQCRHRGRASFDHIRPSGQYRAGHSPAAGLGRAGRALHQLRGGQPALALRVSQAVEPGVETPAQDRSVPVRARPLTRCRRR